MDREMTIAGAVPPSNDAPRSITCIRFMIAVRTTLSLHFHILWSSRNASHPTPDLNEAISRALITVMTYLNSVVLVVGDLCALFY